MFNVKTRRKSQYSYNVMGKYYVDTLNYLRNIDRRPSDNVMNGMENCQ